MKVLLKLEVSEIIKKKCPALESKYSSETVNQWFAELTKY